MIYNRPGKKAWKGAGATNYWKPRT